MDPGSIIAILGLFSVLVTGMIALGPIGRALGDRLRRKGTDGSLAEVQTQLDEVLARLEEVQRQLGDVVERQEFAERVLAKGRNQGALGSGEPA